MPGSSNRARARLFVFCLLAGLMLPVWAQPQAAGTPQANGAPFDAEAPVGRNALTAGPEPRVRPQGSPDHAAIFGTVLITMIPAAQYSGMIDPVSSLQGVGAFIGQIYPATYFMTISRGVFSKALGFDDLSGAFVPLLIAIPVLISLSAAFLKKQER